MAVQELIGQNPSFNKLIAYTGIRDTDRIVLIKEIELADANFLITYHIRHILDVPQSRICFVIMHNTIGHYHNVIKRLGCDLLKKIESGQVRLLDMLTNVFNDLVFPKLKDTNNEDFIKNILTQIAQYVADLVAQTTGNVYVAVDDLSKLLDFGCSIDTVNIFVSYLLMMSRKERKVHLIASVHVGDTRDAILARSIEYASDVNIQVCSLKTGRSHEVSGVMRVQRNDNADVNKEIMYHFKAMSDEVRVFLPGDII